MTTDRHAELGGLDRNRRRLVDRRRALSLVGGLGAAAVLAACGRDPAEPEGAIPAETPGPFPAGGTNGPNVLDLDGVVRPDLRASIGDRSATAPGVATTLELTILDAATGDPRPGAAVYLWHCTADGRYSIYEIGDQNYLRGVQVADDDGRLAFTTLYPGCYPGRWPHAHFEVYRTLDEAETGRSAITTSQLALPRAESEAVYRDARYGDSAASLEALTLAADAVFRDGWEAQLATVAGSVEAGYTATLAVRV